MGASHRWLKCNEEATDNTQAPPDEMDMKDVTLFPLSHYNFDQDSDDDSDDDGDDVGSPGDEAADPAGDYALPPPGRTHA